MPNDLRHRRGTQPRPHYLTLSALSLIAALLLQGTAGALSPPQQGATPPKSEGKVIKPRALKTKLLTKDVAELDAQSRKLRADATKDRTADVRQARSYFSVMSVEFRDARSRLSFKVPGATVFTAHDRFADMYVNASYDPNTDDVIPDPTVVATINQAPGVVMTEFVGAAAPPPPPIGKPDLPTKAIPDTIIRNGLPGLTGKGSVVVIIDSGVDFRNPDFITYDDKNRPTSRLLYLWDTTTDAHDRLKLGTAAPIKYPNGASVGTLYTRQQLTDELRATTKSIPATDLDGHGTSCAGVAAGNGNAAAMKNSGKQRLEVVGVAPDADIVAIRVDEGNGLNGLENAYLLNAAIGWIDTDHLLKNRPVVVSCSFGGQYGGRDGESVRERQLNARLPASRVGRALVIAAGNEGDYRIHAERKFDGQKRKHSVSWQTGPRGAYVEMYFDSADYNDIRIAPAGSTDFRDNGGTVHPIKKHYSTAGYVGPGAGRLYFYTVSGREMNVNVYISGGAFDAGSATFQKLIGTPGTAATAITVGSYDWNDMFNGRSMKDVCGTPANMTIGSISCYSSIGYSRSGQIKPEIVAPGEIYYASYAKDYSAKPEGEGVNPDFYRKNDFIDSSGDYVHFNGTSAATPYVAGVIALMMQKNPSITWGEIRALMQQHAARDRNTTDTVPNIKWGYGKLNKQAAEAMVAAVPKAGLQLRGPTILQPRRRPDGVRRAPSRKRSDRKRSRAWVNLGARRVLAVRSPARLTPMPDRQNAAA